MSIESAHCARWVALHDPISFNATGGQIFPFGLISNANWEQLGTDYTALILVVWCDGASPAPTVALAEASYDGLVAEAGNFAPQQFTVSQGQCISDRWGIDTPWFFWRFSVNGGTGKIGIAGIPRGK